MAITFNTGIMDAAMPISSGISGFIESVDLDSSYPTGGYDFSIINTKFQTDSTVEPGKTPLYVDIEQRWSAGYAFEYNRATGKLMVFDCTTGLEIANDFDLSAVTDLRYVAYGFGWIHGINRAGTEKAGQ